MNDKLLFFAIILIIAYFVSDNFYAVTIWIVLEMLLFNILGCTIVIN